MRDGQGTALEMRAGALRGVRLLVVDDNEDARRILQLFFEYLGAQVILAESGGEALPLVQLAHPHVVISDVAMPHGDGYRLLRDVRALPPSRGGRTPAIAITAFGDQHSEHRAVRAGFDAWLPKPIALPTLYGLVRKFARRSRAA